jgi:hypothetical protein
MRSINPVTRTAIAMAIAANKAESHHGVRKYSHRIFLSFASDRTRGAVAPKITAPNPHPYAANDRSAGIAPNGSAMVVDRPPNAPAKLRRAHAALHPHLASDAPSTSAGC